MQNLIELKNINYSFQNKKSGEHILKGIDLSLAPNQSVGITGKNGSGKSTLLNILATLLRPTSGSYDFAGRDIYKNLKKVRNRINFSSGGSMGFYPRLSAVENIKFYSALKGKILSRKEIESLLHRVQLEPDAFDKKYHKFSLGMRQRMHIARLLLPPCELLLVDEPTNGLDADGAELLTEIFQNDLLHCGKVIVSHDQNFLQKVAERNYNLTEGRFA